MLKTWNHVKLLKKCGYCLTLIGPSLIWSVTFQGFYFCVEPLAFPAIEKKFGRLGAAALKALFLSFFVFALMRSWNILPESYSFYLGVVLKNSPPRIVVIAVAFALLLVISSFQMAPPIFSTKSVQHMMASAMIVLCVKVALVVGAVRADGLNPLIVSPTLTAVRVASEVISNAIAGEAVSGNKADGVPLTPERTFKHYLNEHAKLPDKILLMIVESWAETEAGLAEIKNELNVNNVETVEVGFTTYHGSTLQGEFRELCAKYIDLSKKAVSEISAKNCIPKTLANMGYAVEGLHGYHGEFYTRDIIWQGLGIDNSHFIDDFSSTSVCDGPFAGICDVDLIKRGVDLLSTQGKSFVYLLTLSSHEPISGPLAKLTSKLFRSISAVSASQAIARNTIGELVERIPGKINKCTMVYIVGDHQPPSLAGQDIFSRQKVPYMILNFNCRAK